MSGKHVVIVGGGFAGLAAALESVEAGAEVTLIEQDKELGGLAGTFEFIPGVRLEKFYHHWFSSDTHVLELIRELGLFDKVKFLSSNTGLYYTNSIFRLASPWDLLSFTPIPLLDRIRTGVMALLARKIEDWRSLENISAEDWIIKYGGRKAYEVIWKPLLAGKFGSEASNVSAVWFWNKLKLRGSSRDKKGSEQLLYFEGGFGALTDGMQKALEEKGVKIHLSTSALGVEEKEGKVTAVLTSKGSIPCDCALFTIPLPPFLSLLPHVGGSARAQWERIRFLGNVCLVLRLNKSLSDTYWLNVADPSFPFVGVIEHTNLDDPALYGGERVVYISKYLPTSDALYKLSDEAYFEYCLPFIKKIFPQFERDWINGWATWRAEYSQPVVTLHYSSLIPPYKMPLKGLWLATMAQVYPEDRGTNYAVRLGREVATQLLKEEFSINRSK